MDPLTKFIRVAETIEDFEVEYLRIPEQDHSRYTLAMHTEELHAVWSDLKAAYNQCSDYLVMAADPLNADDDRTADLAVVKSKFQRCYVVYVRLGAKISEHQHLVASTASPVSTSSVSPPVQPNLSGHNINLPPCDTEIFNGDYESWPTFRDMFSAIYIRNNRLSPVEKLFHLNQKTQGEAKDIVQKSPLIDSGFEQAWRNLMDRYENRRILVNVQLRILFDLPPVTKESGVAIQRIQRDINNCLSALMLYDIDVDNWDAIIIHICSTRLPGVILSRWERSLTSKRDIPKWREMDAFLTFHFQSMETVVDLQKASIHPRRAPNHTARSSSTKPVNTFQARMIRQPGCQLCPDQQHPLRFCPRFLAMNLETRWATVRQIPLCPNCLAHSHQLTDCKNTFKCMSCHQRHHTLLHGEVAWAPQPTPHVGLTQSNPPPIIQSTEAPSTSNVLTCFTSQVKQVLLATAMVNIDHRGTSYLVRALIDPGSEATLLSERIQQRLRLPTTPIQARVASVNDSVSATVNKLCTFHLGSPHNADVCIEANALVLPILTSDLPVCSVDLTLLPSLPNVTLADEQLFQSDRIDVLIGADLYPLILLDGIRRNFLGTLVAQETVFGWILTGPITQAIPKSPATRLVFYTDVSLDQQLARFWEVEEIPQQRPCTSAEAYCENLYASTTCRRDDGRYIVFLPFKEGFPSQLRLGCSREIARKQFLRTETKLLKTPDFKGIYDTVLREYAELNHMRLLHASETLSHSSAYYLPHHAVLKPQSSSTKVRVVFNASCSTTNGVSLNDVLHPGPSLQADLTVLILKWRLYKYVFNGDIEKMYRQILVNPMHSRYQRILFRNSPDEEIQDFELQTVTFGVNCAPYLAIRTLHQLAADVIRTFPLAAHVLKHAMYVDDALCGAHDLDTALRIRLELISALHSAGFIMKKWTANHPAILRGIPPDDLLNKDFLELEDYSTTKTLGIRWNAKSDYFHIEAKASNLLLTYTKREMLSRIAQLFDPAGWLAPVVVLAKSLMQQVWLDGIGWDDPLNPQTLQLWTKFVQCYHQIHLIKIPRWIHFTPNCGVEIHAFCDASEKAYAGAVYVCTRNSNEVHVSLLFAKTRVAPLKTISIPRLELCGAALVTDMLNAVFPYLEFPQYDLYCWTDSTIVLAWLKRPPCTWTTFVANRVTKIVDIADSTHWFHVESQHNPADLASRGMYPLELRDTPLWWQGPGWLRQDKKHWPHSATPDTFETELEAKPLRINFVYFNPHEDILERFSSFSRGIRVLSYVFRFFKHTYPSSRLSFQNTDAHVGADEIQFVKTRLILLAQKVHFANDYHSLEMKEPLEPKSCILSLNPFLSPNGILRVGGRLASCPSLSYDERHPILLPYNCAFTRLLVLFVHDISLHGTNQLMLRLLRTQFWILKAKNLIKSTIHNCKSCILQRKQVRTQLMAALPPERTTLSRPFAATGLDFAGPFDIKNYTGRACRITKGYVCVFICFATKAIHLEAVSDLSTPTFIAAFNRFISRRGCPADLYSDNGKNFVGAATVFRRDWEAFLTQSREVVSSTYAYQHFKWHFIPAAAPHMGGLWEAGVKSFKLHFRKFIGNQRFTFEEFSTILYRIEACLNSRPLSSMSDNPSDLQPLTPGHFIVGGPLLAPAEPELLSSSVKLVNRWQRVKAAYQQFCNRWKNEYLLELHRRTKWKCPQPNLKLDDLVVLRDDNLPPTMWRLGRIVHVYPSSDDRTRVADVRTEKGTITRPLRKLVLLP